MIATKPVVCFLIKLGRHVSHGERMNTIDFEGQRSRSQWAYIQTETLCASSSNLADMLIMVNPIDWRSHFKGEGLDGYH